MPPWSGGLEIIMNKNDLKKIIAISAVTAAAAAATVIVVSHYRKTKEEMRQHELSIKNKTAYITGGGLSAFAAALYLVRDCGMDAARVHIFMNTKYNHGDEETGYICRRGKVINEKSSNLFELLCDINSLDIPDLTVCDEILNIYSANPIMRNISFIDDEKNVIDISDIRLNKEHRSTIISLMKENKEKLRNMPIDEAFPANFFTSYFWKLISAAYGFSAESNTYEFINAVTHMDDMLSGTLPADFDRQEEIIEPLKAHLKSIGVDIRENAKVTDIDFEDSSVSAIHFTDDGVRKSVYPDGDDICIFPTDEMSECASCGSFTQSAPRIFPAPFKLWEKLAEKHPAFKNPTALFCDDDSNMSEEFTITLSNRMLPELIDKVTCGALGLDGVIVLDNSNWKMTICAVPPSHFKNQSEDIAIIWGTAARPERDGEYCTKPMTGCSGAEILYELVSCMNLDEAWDDIRETVINVIPCHRRYDKSYLAPVTSKLEIIPTGISNFAISGDFAENESGIVFTEEYAVATARKAAYKLMNNKRKIYQSKPVSLRRIKKTLRNLVK